ncbi:MAG: hypothetical protein JWO38_7175 [Gemmataceae bacterium]|nr:hypothetical protein [Gemmataceae bacterium]
MMLATQHVVPTTSDGGSSVGWATVLDRLTAPPSSAAGPAPPAGGGHAIALNERLTLVGGFVLAAILAGRNVTAGDVHRGDEQFRECYTSANALGTVLGKGVAGHGFGLARRRGVITPCYSNAYQIVVKPSGLGPDRLARAAAEASHSDADSLLAAVEQLPRS